MSGNTYGGSDDAYHAAVADSAQNVCQGDVCEQEHCDLGGGDCRACHIARSRPGAICGGCHRALPERGLRFCAGREGVGTGSVTRAQRRYEETGR